MTKRRFQALFRKLYDGIGLFVSYVLQITYGSPFRVDGKEYILLYCFLTQVRMPIYGV